MPITVSDALKEFFNDATYPIIFTGAGISVRTGLPTWNRLIEQLAEGIRSVDPLTTQQMLEDAHAGDLTHAVDYFWLSRKMLDGDKQKLLRAIFSNYDTAPILPVATLPFRGCLTTNFDKSILDAIAIAKKQAANDYKLGDLSFKQAQWEEGLFVARIHGSVEMPGEMVLSEKQFNSLLKDDAYFELLRSIFLHKNVLFIGFSFYDPAIRYVFQELDKRFGVASPGRHMALLPSGASSEFIQKANRLNIKVVQYDSANGHAALWDGISKFNAEKDGLHPPLHTPKSSPFDFTKQYLAACYARAKSQDLSVALRVSVIEGIVSAMLQEVAPKAISHPELLEKIRVALGLKGHEAESILKKAVKSLTDSGLCRKLKGDGGRGIKLAWNGQISVEDSLDFAIKTLTESVISRAYLQEGWKTGQEVIDTITAFFNQLIRRRGWDLGAAFAAGRAPETVAIAGVLYECAIGLSAFDLERLLRVCESMLQHPSETEASILSELGRISFAVELAFQSPLSFLVQKTILPSAIYFDANVLLPALVTGHPFSEIYRDAIKQLKNAASEAATPLRLVVITEYLNEIISHKRSAEAFSAQLGDDFPSVARSDALYHGLTHVNVYVGAYANWLENNEVISFKDFLARFAPYNTDEQLKVWLIKQGFVIVSLPKGPNYSEFYSLLEKTYANSLSYGKTPILIDHDSKQLSILESEVRKGEKSLFVTADRKLQQIATEARFSTAASMMISHVGLVQFIELLLGGTAKGGVGLTELLWSARISDRAQAVRSYFTTLALEQYDDAMAMTLPDIIEHSSELATRELDRVGANLDSEDPNKRAEAFRQLGRLEKNYLSGMHEAVEKLRAKLSE